jgi:DegV family protein with EDD domain
MMGDHGLHRAYSVAAEFRRRGVPVVMGGIGDNMGHVRVVTDSGADLPAEAAADAGIKVIPLVVRFGEEVYLDGQLSAEEFWRKAAECAEHPATSQPAVGVFEETFATLVDIGHAVLCLTITSKHSGTFSTASAAAARFGGQVRVMDTLSLSLGQGFQVLAAARAARSGLSLDDVAGLVERVREQTHVSILLDTIEYIRRGGRADALIPVLDRVTRLLRIKPVLRLIDGQLGLCGLARSYERGLVQIEQDTARLQPLEQLGVIHVHCPEAAEQVARALAERLGFPLRDILVTETGAALSAHGGPKTIGVAAVQRAAG